MEMAKVADVINFDVHFNKLIMGHRYIERITENISFNQYGITYNFQLPKIEESDWANTISDIGILTFIQGVPLGTTGEYYNSYALGGAGVIKRPLYLLQISF